MGHGTPEAPSEAADVGTLKTLARGVARSDWPLWLSISVYTATLAVLWLAATVRTGGVWVYPLDDTYIHMAIAQTLAEHGVWGVSPDEAAFASSSPLWTFLLAVAFRLTPLRESAPMMLASLSGCLFLAVLSGATKAAVPTSDHRRFFILLLALLVLPLVPLTMLGMEHVLHCALVLLLVRRVSDAVEDELRGEDAWATVSLIVYAALLCATRFESVFVIAVCACVLLWFGRTRMACFLCLAGALPILVHGLASLHSGWFFLPTSVVLKGNAPDLNNIKGLVRSIGCVDGLARFGKVPEIFWLLILTAIGMGWATTKKADAQRVLVPGSVLFAVTLPHLQFASTGWFYRYEAYLLALGFPVALALMPAVPHISAPFRDRLRIQHALALAAAAIICLPFGLRTVLSLRNIPVAVFDRFSEQYQIARFLTECYPDTPVAANDIGAVCYFGNQRVLDLWGLASVDIARLKLARRYDTHAIQTLADEAGIGLAVAYESWFTGASRLPSSWTKVGEWRFPGRTVSFFATSVSDVDRLRSDLGLFVARLPPNVKARGEHRLIESPRVPD